MIYVLLGDGFEELEVVAPTDILRRGGVEVKLVALKGKTVRGAHGIALEADLTLDEAKASEAEGIFVPGGMGGVNAISGCPAALALLKEVAQAGGYVTAICAGPTVLAKLGLLEGKNATCYPGMEEELTGAECSQERVVVDGKTVTSRAPGTAMAFGFRLLELLKGKAATERVQYAMCWQET